MNSTFMISDQFEITREFQEMPQRFMKCGVCLSKCKTSGASSTCSSFQAYQNLFLTLDESSHHGLSSRSPSSVRRVSQSSESVTHPNLPPLRIGPFSAYAFRFPGSSSRNGVCLGTFLALNFSSHKKIFGEMF